MECSSCPSYFTAKTNKKKNQQEEIGIIDLNPINICMKTGEILIHQPKNLKG